MKINVNNLSFRVQLNVLPIVIGLEGDPSPTTFVATTVKVMLVDGGHDDDDDVLNMWLHIVELQVAVANAHTLLDKEST